MRAYKYIILLLFMIYVIYLFIEQPISDEDDPYNFSKYQLLQLDRHKQGIETISQKGGKLTGIIMGGSNAMAGLSAKQMTRNNYNQSFYNYSLAGSKKKTNIYLDSLREISLLVDKEAVKVVIFSDLMFFLDSKSGDYESLEQNRFRLKIFPSTPLLRLLRYKFIPVNPLFPRNIEFGDLDWGGSYSDVCREPESFDMIPNNIKDIRQRHTKIRNSVQEMFPNSKIYFMVPSISNNSSDLLLKYFNDIKILYEESNLHLILNPPRKEMDIFCYSGFYLNQKGRTLVTNEIIEIISKGSN